MSDPLVSCVMPTWNRRRFILAAVDCWLKQTYENRELVILDDGEEPVEDLLPEDPMIRYVFENKRLCTGDKRNRVNSLARGEIICHFDDDDWSAATRIQRQIDILAQTGKIVTGFSNLLFWKADESRPMIYRSRIPGYVCGTTLCYRRDFWEIHRFRSKQEASDNDFVYPITREIAASKETNQMVARIHSCHHTSKKIGINEEIGRSEIPEEFWENERLIITGGPNGRNNEQGEIQVP